MDILSVQPYIRTIYVKSTDGRMVGAVKLKPRGSAQRVIASLKEQGYVRIDYQEFRRIKTRILHHDHETKRIPVAGTPNG